MLQLHAGCASHSCSQEHVGSKVWSLENLEIGVEAKKVLECDKVCRG